MGVWLPAALSCSAIRVSDDKLVQRSLQYFVGPSNEYQLEESITKPYPTDQKASEGEKHRMKTGRVKNKTKSGSSNPIYCHIFSDGESLWKGMCEGRCCKEKSGNFLLRGQACSCILLSNTHAGKKGYCSTNLLLKELGSMACVVEMTSFLLMLAAVEVLLPVELWVY